jgi:hypothetical protein
VRFQTKLSAQLPVARTLHFGPVLVAASEHDCLSPLDLICASSWGLNLLPKLSFERSRPVSTQVSCAQIQLFLAPVGRILTFGEMPRPLRIAFFNCQEQASGAEQLTRETVEGLNGRGHEARLYVKMRSRSPRAYVHKIPYFRGEENLEARLRRLTGWNDYFFPSTWRIARDPWVKSADIWHFHNLHGHYISIPILSRHSRRRPVVLSPVDEFLTTGYCPYSLGCDRFRFGCGSCPQLDLPYPGISRDATHRLWNMKRGALSRGRFHYLLHTDYLFNHFRSALSIQKNIERLYYGVNLKVNKPMPRGECAEQRGLKSFRTARRRPFSQ